MLPGRGADGVPAPRPVDFATLVLPASPNTCLLTPGAAPGAGHLHRDPFPVMPERAFGAAARLRPRRISRAAPAQWVARTRLMNYPDIIVAEVAPAGAGTGLWLHSRSLIGRSDLGVNRARVMTPLAAFEDRPGRE